MGLPRGRPFFLWRHPSKHFDSDRFELVQPGCSFHELPDAKRRSWRRPRRIAFFFVVLRAVAPRRVWLPRYFPFAFGVRGRWGRMAGMRSVLPLVAAVYGLTLVGACGGEASTAPANNQCGQCADRAPPSNSDAGHSLLVLIDAIYAIERRPAEASSEFRKLRLDLLDNPAEWDNTAGLLISWAPPRGVEHEYVWTLCVLADAGEPRSLRWFGRKQVHTPTGNISLREFLERQELAGYEAAWLAAASSLTIERSEGLSIVLRSVED